ncbi:MAG: TlyA family RNA methyltransferase, partial [Ureaplasma sp.]|nr:TlyA family RNA methyltransferase [Ureaplasma sp.]
NKIRSDQYLIQNNYCQTRSQAQQLIKLGNVIVDNKIIFKNNFLVNKTNKIFTNKLKYVSRGGFKLEHAFNEFDIYPENKIVLDIGASTGGFTDCCLKFGAKKVYALDVGTKQLDPILLLDNRVESLEQINLKSINKSLFSSKIDFIVCDVSFISLKHVFSVLKDFYDSKIDLIFLIKPQFELDKKIMTKNKGFVKSEKERKIAIDNVIKYAKENNLKLIKLIESPIAGNKKNNIEYLGYFKWQKPSLC